MIPLKHRDVVVIVEKKKYHLHKVILSRVPYFDTLLSSEFYKGEDIRLEDIRDIDFQVILQIIYKPFSNLPTFTLGNFEVMELGVFLGMKDSLLISLRRLKDNIMQKSMKEYPETSVIRPETRRRFHMVDVEKYIAYSAYLDEKVPIDLPIDTYFLQGDEYPYSEIHYLLLQAKNDRNIIEGNDVPIVLKMYKESYGYEGSNMEDIVNDYFANHVV